MRFSSVEVRWFFDGGLDPDSEVVAWFRNRDTLPAYGTPHPLEWPARAREDTYLVLPGQNAMGIKWRAAAGPDHRGAMLEFKGATALLGTAHRLGPDATGRVERWMKWSIPADTVPAEVAGLLDPGALPINVSVAKSRLVRTIRLSALGHAAEVPLPEAGAELDRGLAFELTRIQVAGDPYWSLGVEAFPDEPTVTDAFDGVVAQLLSGYPGPALTASNSWSYPGWLQRLVTHE